MRDSCQIFLRVLHDALTHSVWFFSKDLSHCLYASNAAAHWYSLVGKQCGQSIFSRVQINIGKVAPRQLPAWLALFKEGEVALSGRRQLVCLDKDFKFVIEVPAKCSKKVLVEQG